MSQGEIKQLLITALQSQVRGSVLPSVLTIADIFVWLVWCVTKLSRQQADKHIKVLLRARHEFLKLIRPLPWCSVSMKLDFKVLSCWIWHSQPSCGFHWQVALLNDFIFQFLSAHFLFPFLFVSLFYPAVPYCWLFFLSCCISLAVPCFYKSIFYLHVFPLCTPVPFLSLLLCDKTALNVHESNLSHPLPSTFLWAT